MKDLHTLPKVRDSWSYLYVEHCRIDQDAKAIAIHDAAGKTPVPCASLTLLMLGPGTRITHAAIRTLADNGCLVTWTGEGAVRFYALGMGETRSARNLLVQARRWADPAQRLAVVRRMYSIRFPEPLGENLTLQQIRGKEGIRVREAYARASRETGIPWRGRSYRRERWDSADPVNRALSAANSCLYGVCHAAIVSAGFSPALGFVHTGKMLSFVYDVADLYKTELTVPIAFRCVAEGETRLESRVRHACRDAFREQRILDRIVPDLVRVLSLAGEDEDAGFDSDEALPGGLWDPEGGEAAGGVNWGEGMEVCAESE
jgi:CRISPR-associated protein Cas1